MAILKIARMGHPVLRKSANPIDLSDLRLESIRSLINDMFATMNDYGGIGLAAPQVHESLQIAVIKLAPNNPRYPNLGEQGPLIIVNPKITVIEPTKQEFWEGCLSIPGLRGLVGRPRKINLDFFDEKAEPVFMEFEGFLSTVVQHELDHLFGNLYVDHLKSTQQFAFNDEYQRYHMVQTDSEAPPPTVEES